MNFYKVTVENTEDKPQYVGIREDARKQVIENYPKTMWPFARVELVDIKVDQQTVASILSGWGAAETVQRTWAITARGGLKEVANGD